MLLGKEKQEFLASAFFFLYAKCVQNLLIKFAGCFKTYFDKVYCENKCICKALFLLLSSQIYNFKESVLNMMEHRL